MKDQRVPTQAGEREGERESGMGILPLRPGAPSRDLGWAGFQASDELFAEPEVSGGPPGTGRHQEGI